jgi:hypothetical protein
VKFGDILNIINVILCYNYTFQTAHVERGFIIHR